MRLSSITKYLTLAVLFVAFPFRVETDNSGRWVLVASYAHAKSGSGSDGDGGDDGEGDDGEGDSDGDDGEGDDGGDDGEGDDDGDDGEGDDGEGDDDDDDGEDASSDGQKARPVDVRKLSNGARVTYSDGSLEEIANGNFSRTNANGRVVERRRARGSDLARMRALFSKAKPSTTKSQPAVKSRAVKATYRGKDVDILYANGWREQIKSGRFTLTDKYGRVVTSRRATQDDLTRLNRFRK